jgi:hypothetical protein
MPEWVIALTSAVVGGAAGACLAVFLARRWETTRLARELARRDLALLDTFREDMILNLNRIKMLQQILYAEIPYLTRGAMVVDPLPLFVANYWDALKTSQPIWLRADPWLLATIRDVSEHLDRLNAVIRSREFYRIASDGGAGYVDRIAAYDKSLFEASSAVEPLLERLLERLPVR